MQLLNSDFFLEPCDSINIIFSVNKVRILNEFSKQLEELAIF